MRFEVVKQDAGLRTFVIEFVTGDEVVSLVKQLVVAQNITAAEITALGGISDATLLCFDWDKQDYVSTSLPMQLEIGSLIGQVGQPPGVPQSFVHMHAVVAKSDATAFSGHLGAAHARPIVQMILREVDQNLRMMVNAKTAFMLGRTRT
jgi:predicted DNA-binding protein with PD1-like motif